MAHKVAVKDRQGELDSLVEDEQLQPDSQSAHSSQDLRRRMTTGVTVLKHDEAGRGPPKTKALWVSSDATLICWQSLADNRDASRLRAADMIAVMRGCSDNVRGSKAFKKSADSATAVDDLEWDCRCLLFAVCCLPFAVCCLLFDVAVAVAVTVC